MFRLTVESVFSAAHALVIRGVREAIHGHDWRVTVTVEGPELDEDGLLCDFHAVQADLEDVVRPFKNANLNEVSPFRPGSGGRSVNPSAEEVARHIACELSGRHQTRMAREPKHGGSRVVSVRVTEAVGCAAVYELGPKREAAE
ncbi:MAG: 6-pyruvoyl trahydropterin synthase family protein [Phycisphaerales bacterium]